MSAPRGLVLVLGHGPAAPGGLAELSARLHTFAVRAGLARVRVEITRVPGSTSRYLYADDSAGRRWKLRLSNHRRPADASVPHFDLVAQDGRSGFDEAARFLLRVAAGEVGWFDERATGRRLAASQRRRWGRRR